MRLSAPLERLAASPWRLRAYALALAAVCTLALATLAPDVLRSVEERAGDMAWRYAAARAPAADEERRVVVVDIDEASIARIGPWPWPRERIAELSRRLGALGATLQVYDIVLPEQRPGDALVAAELARQQVVLGQIFSLDPATQVTIGQVQGALKSGTPRCGAPLPQASGFIANAPAFASVGLTAGHITPRIGYDGAVRHLPAVICFEGRAYPSLALAALVKGAGAESAWVLSEGADWRDPAWRLTHPQLPGIAVPLDENGDVRVSYRLPRRALVSVSAADVLSGQGPEELFRGAWALVGATAFGIGDAVPTPHGGAVAGVEVNAQFIAALLDARLPYTPRGASIVLFALALAGALALLLVARSRRLPSLALPLAGLVLASAFVALHGWLQLSQNVWLGWMQPAAFCLVAGVLLAGAEYARARFERERLYGNLASYLPEPVAAEIAYREPTGTIDAERREITVLFADIRNFSAYCERRPPEEAAALLHAFFTTAARVIESNGGLVEEFVADGVMAIWNAPRPCPGHPAKALAAATALQRDTAQLFDQPAPEGLEPLALGVAIETGTALVGSFGPAHRRTHTALGETVTIAARLQALTADLAQPILIGEGAAAQLPQDAVISLGSFLLEGLRTPRQVYAPPMANRTGDEPRVPRRPRLIAGFRKS